MAKILIIDDDIEICKMLSKIIKSINHDAEVSFTLKDGLKKAKTDSFDIVLLDVQLPDGDGLGAIEEIKDTSSSPEVIITTGYGNPDGAELAITNRAWDYIEKPYSNEQIILPLTRALEYRKEKLNRKPPAVLKRDKIIGNSPRMRVCLDLITQAAASDANVLVTGETGTGKELCALTIHENSSRSNKNFVIVDCTTLPENLIESILFGHDKGAFTGADKVKKGLIEQAHEGTLFLDEVGELSLDKQKAFLRVLQERRFRPVGSSREVASNFRLITATNRNLEHMVHDGTFREDLLFRLRTITIDQPPLRECTNDIKDLVLFYVFEYCSDNNIETKSLSPEYLEMLMTYDWPGNVRELVNTIEWSVIAALQEHTLFPTHIPTSLRIKLARASVGERGQSVKRKYAKTDFSGGFKRLKEYRKDALEEIEKQYLQDVLSFTNGSRKETCRIIGVSRTRLYTLMKKYNIS